MEMLRAAEVARVALRDVNRAIDGRLLPEELSSHDEARRLAATACPLIAFYFDSARRLTAEERLFAIREAGTRMLDGRIEALSAMVGRDWVVRDEFLSIDLAPFVRRAAERMERLAMARERVVRDPEILGGVPVVRGTRVPVHDVAASVAAGAGMKRILAGYPSLDADAVELAALYAEANPVRGRPRAGSGMLEGMVVGGERRMAWRNADIGRASPSGPEDADAQHRLSTRTIKSEQGA